MDWSILFGELLSKTLGETHYSFWIVFHGIFNVHLSRQMEIWFKLSSEGWHFWQSNNPQHCIRIILDDVIPSLDSPTFWLRSESAATEWHSCTWRKQTLNISWNYSVMPHQFLLQTKIWYWATSGPQFKLFDVKWTQMLPGRPSWVI